MLSADPAGQLAGEGFYCVRHVVDGSHARAETLVQNRLATALLGDQARYDGLARSAPYRWFTDPRERRVYPEADHDLQASVQVANLRGGPDQGRPGQPAPPLSPVGYGPRAGSSSASGPGTM